MKGEKKIGYLAEKFSHTPPNVEEEMNTIIILSTILSFSRCLLLAASHVFTWSLLAFQQHLWCTLAWLEREGRRKGGMGKREGSWTLAPMCSSHSPMFCLPLMGEQSNWCGISILLRVADPDAALVSTDPLSPLSHASTYWSSEPFDIDVINIIRCL